MEKILADILCQEMVLIIEITYEFRKAGTIFKVTMAFCSRGFLLKMNINSSRDWRGMDFVTGIRNCSWGGEESV